MKIEEHAEHAEHASQHGNKGAALLIAVLAAGLAICEQQAKRADIAVETNSILSADTWNEYQAKSVRSAVARDLERFATTLDAPAQPGQAAARATFIKQLQSDQVHYEKDTPSGKAALRDSALRYEEIRHSSLERAHTYDNAAAALELGIVLATASVIAGSMLLFRFAFVMGGLGVVLGFAGWLAPALLVF